MPNTTISPNMGLPVPNVGVDPGPDWANNLNSSLSILDSHNHTPGSGNPIPVAGLSVNVDLPLNMNNLVTVRSVRFTSQLVPLSFVTDLGCLYEAGVDLYYNDGNGNQIRITQGGSIAGASGTITGLVAPASASYSSGISTFIFQSDVNKAANLDAGSLVLRNLTTSSFGLTLNPPALSSDYSIVLPQLPVSQSVTTIDSSGNIATPISYADLLALINNAAPAGVVQAYTGTVAPTSWLMCDGTLVSRTTYANLYAVIGDAYGSGDGSTTFQLPDLRGVFLRGTDNGRGFDPDAASRFASGTGGNAGDAVGSIQSSDNAAHTHGVNDPNHQHTINAVTFGSPSVGPAVLIGNGSSNLSPFSGAVNAAVTGITIQSSGGAESRPVNVYVNYIIKY